MKIRVIRGLPIVDAPWFLEKNIEDTMDYVPHDGDVIVASYPKTGTTWLQYIVLQIVTRGEKYPSFDDMLYKVVPYMEMAGAAAIDAIEGPRIYKHHYPYNMVQKNDKAKTLYIYRNPEDIVVSFYHFVKGLFEGPIDFDGFYEDFLLGNVNYGNYFKHILSFFAHKNDENVLLISYEKLHANRKDELLRIAKFLGEDHYQSLVNDASLLEKVMEHTSFDYMKRNLALTHPGGTSEGHPKKTVNFFRKGIVGDGKNSLSPDQLERLRNMTMEFMKGTELINEWIKD